MAGFGFRVLSQWGFDSGDVDCPYESSPLSIRRVMGNYEICVGCNGGWLLAAVYGCESDAIAAAHELRDAYGEYAMWQADPGWCHERTWRTDVPPLYYQMPQPMHQDARLGQSGAGRKKKGRAGGSIQCLLPALPFPLPPEHLRVPLGFLHHGRAQPDPCFPAGRGLRGLPRELGFFLLRQFCHFFFQIFNISIC